MCAMFVCCLVCVVVYVFVFLCVVYVCSFPCCIVVVFFVILFWGELFVCAVLCCCLLFSLLCVVFFVFVDCPELEEGSGRSVAGVFKDARLIGFNMPPQNKHISIKR